VPRKGADKSAQESAAVVRLVVQKNKENKHGNVA